MKRPLSLAGVSAVLLHAATTTAATLPPELPGIDRLHRPHPAHGGALRVRRSRLRRREERPHQGLRRASTDPTPTIFADLRTNVHNYWDRGLLGPGARIRTSRRRPTSTCSTRSTRRAGRARSRAGERQAPPPTAARPRRGRRRRLSVDGAPLAPAGGGQRDDGHRAGADRGLVPAVPEPLDRRPRLRAGRRALRQRRRRRQLQRRRLRAVRRDRQRPLEPVRRPARSASGGTQTPPTAPRAAPCAARASRRPGRAGRPRRRDPAPRPGDRAGAARQPARRPAPTPTRAASSRYGLRNPFRFALRPGTNEIWVGDVGWSTLGGDQPDRPDGRDACQNFGWPCYEGGVAPRPATTRPTSTSCESLYATSGAVDGPLLRLRARARRSSPARPARPAARRSPASRSTRAESYPAAYDGALFFADYSRRCIWAMMPDGGGHARSRRRRHVRRRASRAAPSTCRSAPAATSSTSTSTAAASSASATSPTNQPPTAVAQRRPHERPGAADGAASTARGSSDPDGDTLTYAWDLDGDGAVRRLDRGRADPHVHEPGHVHRAAPGHRSRGSDRRRRRSRSARTTRRRRRRSTRPGRRSPGRSATRSRSRDRAPTRSRARCRRRP